MCMYDHATGVILIMYIHRNEKLHSISVLLSCITNYNNNNNDKSMA